MRKVLDKDLEKKIKGIVGEKAIEVVLLLKEIQDAGGMKVCQNVSKDDIAYKELK